VSHREGELQGRAVGEAARRKVFAGGFLVEFEVGLGLVRADAAGGDIGLKIVFALDGMAGHAAKHGELADVVQGVGDRPLEEFFGGGVERLISGEIVVELLEGGEEALSFVVPGHGLGVVPSGLTFDHGERPIEKIAEVSENLHGGTGGFGGAEIGEGIGRVLEGLRTAIGDGGKGVAQEVASAGGWGEHKGGNLSACARVEKTFCRPAASARCNPSRIQDPSIGVLSFQL